MRYVIMGHSFAGSIALKVANMAAEHVAADVLVDPVAPVAMASEIPGPPSAPPPENFATIEDAERHFRDTEEGKWNEDGLRRFVQDVMMRDDKNSPLRFPYTRARLSRLRAFTASRESDYNLFAEAKFVRCPVLVFRGGMSKRFPLAAEQPFLKVFTSKPKIVVCAESGHFPTATEPEITTAELKRFLEGIR